MCQVPAQVTAAWEGADNHFIIPLSGPGLNCLPREHSGGLEKIARKYGKQRLRPLNCQQMRPKSFCQIFLHVLMRIFVNPVREWVGMRIEVSGALPPVNLRSHQDLLRRGGSWCSDLQSLSGLITGPRRLLTTVSRHANMASKRRN